MTIEGDGITKTASSQAGGFTIVASAGATDPRGVSFASLNFISRYTYLRVPGPDALVSLIPNSFDLAAFNEMFRKSQDGLERWVAAPPLRVQTRTLQFNTLTDTTLTAIDDTMTDAEYASIVQDLTWALPQLTGGTFTAFASVSKDTARPGEAVRLLADGVITVARVSGLTGGSGYWGYTRWLPQNDGSIFGGLSMIDLGYDRSGSPFARSLRAHELGHALGYNHVTVRPSVMNADARTEPNDFDRAGARIAFQRRPGNRSPDVDPTASGSINRVNLAPRGWTAPVF